MNYTDEVAEYILGAGRSVETEGHVVLHAVVDTVAVAFAASDTHLTRRVRSILGDGGPHAFWGTPQAGSAVDAAYHNGVMAHALDFDDMSECVRGHLSSVIIPAFLAMSFNHTAGKAAEVASRFADAYGVAAQVAGSLAAGVSLSGHYKKGWHSTATIGAVAAAAGLSRLLKLDRQTTKNALGIAASGASGFRQNFGSDTKALHVGAAAAHAVRAIELATCGLSADGDSLGGTTGFLRVFGEPADALAASSILHGDSVLDSPGINIKLIPCCYELQRTAYAALNLSKDFRDDVGSIHVTLNPGAADPLLLRYPSNGREAQFSPAFVVAAALKTGRLDLGSFTDSEVDDADLRMIADRVTVVEAVVPPASKAPIARFAVVQLSDQDGSMSSSLVEEVPGSAARGVTRKEVLSKVTSCLSVRGRADLAEELFSSAKALVERGESAPLQMIIAELSQTGV